ncbi:MAG: AAA family ATPase [Caldilineaceae bacterium]
MTNNASKRIPYGNADYRRLRLDNSYYVDKTSYIPLLEAAPYYLFCIRPRRFGKTLWLTTLDMYYDVNERENFDKLFGDTYIGHQPTAERNSYLTITFNFAVVNPALDQVQTSFETYGSQVIQNFLHRYDQFFEESETKKILQQPNTENQLSQIFFFAAAKGLKIYLFIDEYDNFTNTILTTAGQAAYHQITHGAGFYRHFFNMLKGATTGKMAGLTRLFITGVSPVTMDDVTSGFNIGLNISLDAKFNAMIGFTEAETKVMVDYYHTVGELSLESKQCMAIMQTWYDNYRFSKSAPEKMFNSDMVLYFILNAISQQQVPDNLIDQNIRIDYTKLRHFITVDKHLNGNFSQLKSIIETGEAVSPVVQSFPLERLLERENFISLLVYFGLLTFAGEREGQPLLRIPNATIKDLMYGYLRESYRDVDVFRIDPWHLSKFLQGMAYRGEWQPFFDFLAQEVKQQLSIRDYLNGEKMIQGFLLAYLNVTHFFLTWSEREMGGGFVDLYLEPFLARYTDMKYGYLIELKYMARNEYSNVKLQEKIDEAATQFARYANDERIRNVADRVSLKYLTIIYSGWELVYREEWMP